MISKTERRICGTCQYWKGSREPFFDETEELKVDIADEYGMCMYFRVGETVSRRRDLKCGFYSKWAEII